MTESHSVCNRIRNARASLDNAERSFRSNQDVRGELDLMLAEAELENLRQKRTGLFSWTRHVLALCLAVLLLAAGGLGWWWASSYGGNTTSAAGRQGLSAGDVQNGAAAGQKQVLVKTAEGVGHVIKTKPDSRQKKSLPETAAAVSIPKKESSGSVSLSSSQMKQLIRSGKQELGTVK